ncbi:MAG: hypothetical protein AB7F89_14525, partial [Pirellulaceae bacterium]
MTTNRRLVRLIRRVVFLLTSDDVLWAEIQGLFEECGAETESPAPATTGPTRSSWTSFVPVIEIPAGGDDPGGTMYRNSRYSVAVRRHPEHYHLAIIVNDHSARHDWRDFQRIKNELLGPDAEAVELYPSEDRLIDTSNTFHLWSPVGQRFPFGFDKGR